MKKSLLFRSPALLTAGLLITFLSCATNPKVFEEVDAGVRAGSYEKALAVLNDEKSKVRKANYPPKNEILLCLDRGMVAHYAGHYKDSSEDLETADLLIEEAFRASMGQAIGSYILNDNVKDYSGEDYEDLYVNVFNALNYYHKNDLEGALVEIRRLNEKLNYLEDKYERAKKKVLDENQQLDPTELPMEASRFSNSALARYLGVLFYRGTGRSDSARVDYNELRQAYDLAPDVYSNPLPSSLEEELSVPKGKARLNVIAFSGLSPFKEEEKIVVPLPLPFPNNFANLQFPKMVKRHQSVERAEVVLGSGEKFPLELVEDMSSVAVETFKSKRGLIILKTTLRTIIKNTSGAVASAVVAKKSNEGVGFLVGVAGKVFTEASENADIRLSRYFPSRALVGGINLEPGNSTVTVNFYGSGGLISSERREVRVRENTLNLEEFICLR